MNAELESSVEFSKITHRNLVSLGLVLARCELEIFSLWQRGASDDKILMTKQRMQNDPKLIYISMRRRWKTHFAAKLQLLAPRRPATEKKFKFSLVKRRVVSGNFHQKSCSISSVLGRSNKLWMMNYVEPFALPEHGGVAGDSKKTFAFQGFSCLMGKNTEAFLRPKGDENNYRILQLVSLTHWEAANTMSSWKLFELLE